jgi:flagellar motor switch protein FliG
MRKEDRVTAARLEGIMKRHEDREKQTLYELRKAGFEFKTIADARRRLSLQRRLPGFTQDQIDIALRVALKQEQEKNA